MARYTKKLSNKSKHKQIQKANKIKQIGKTIKNKHF